jgi:hypothetical protein
MQADMFLSEVHIGCPQEAHTLTRFAFFPPPEIGQLGRGSLSLSSTREEERDGDCMEQSEQEDGDLRVRRKRRRTDGQQCITIRHCTTTSLPNVGMQVRSEFRNEGLGCRV